MGSRTQTSLDKLPVQPTARRDKLVALIERVSAKELPLVLAACEAFVRNGAPAITMPVMDACRKRDPDPRIAELASRLLAEPPPGCTKILTRQFRRIIKRHGDGTTAPTPARLETTRGKLDEAALLAEVAAHPDDDAARTVLADHWTMKGDVRGEFITLQLARRAAKPSAEAKRREAELLANHRVALFGPFANCVKRTGAKFERGFLVRAAATTKWPLHPLNALLEHVDFDNNPLPLGEWRSLVEAWNPPLATLAELIAHAPRLAGVGFTYTRDAADLIAAFNRVSRSLDRVTIMTWGADGARDCTAAATRSPIAATATWITVNAHYPSPTSLGLLLALLPRTCTRFTFAKDSFPEIKFELVRDGATWSLASEIKAVEDVQIERLEAELEQAIAGLPPLARAQFVVIGSMPLTAILRAVAAIPNATVEMRYFK